MALAYLLIVHKSPDQLLGLTKAIYHPDNLYTIHVDKTSPKELHALAQILASKNKNIHLIKSINCYHAGYSLVRAQLAGMKELIGMGNNWSHIINLSGEDFPLIEQQKIIDELDNQKEKNFIDIFDPLTQKRWKNAPARWDGIYYEPHGQKRAKRFLKIRIPRTWTLGKNRIYGGSQWFILSNSFCKYATNLKYNWWARLFFKNTYVPDESFFQTIIMNSPFSNSIIPDNRRYIDWETGPERPRIIRMQDYDNIISSGALFARKFSPKIDNNIIALLESRLLEKAAVQPMV